jgi:kynurenine formamidase
MKVVDLSHTIKPDMPFFPGTEPPLFIKATTIDKEGFTEKKITFYSHTGTHVDAPGHILQGARTLDKFTAGKFVGKGMVLDLESFPECSLVEKDFLEKYCSEIEAHDFVLIRTGWDRKWGKEEYFGNFPVLTPDAAKWLTGFRLKGIGIDCISADPVQSALLQNHRILLGSNILIIENLCNLEQLAGKEFLFCCLPLKTGDSDGFPVRAVGIYNYITDDLEDIDCF